jgi:hypothetical protein
MGSYRWVGAIHHHRDVFPRLIYTFSMHSSAFHFRSCVWDSPIDSRHAQAEHVQRTLHGIAGRVHRILDDRRGGWLKVMRK